MMLPDPLKTACATGRVIEARANSIANLGSQIAAISDPAAVASEDWQVLSDSLNKLLSELKGEIDTFIEKAAYAP
jgi:hypothetical protein